MKYPAREYKANLKESRNQRFKNLCRIYNDADSWEEFKINADLAKISIFDNFRFWLYYVCINNNKSRVLAFICSMLFISVAALTIFICYMTLPPVSRGDWTAVIFLSIIGGVISSFLVAMTINCIIDHLDKYLYQ